MGRSSTPAADQESGSVAFVGDDLGDARQGRDLCGSPRGVAAHDDDPRPGIVAGQPPDQLPALGIALGGHRAGVHHAQVGRFIAAGLAVADPQQPFADVLGLVLIDLTAERAGAEHRGHPADSSGSIVALHRPLAAGDHGILAEGVDLVAFQFGVLPGGGQADRAALLVHGLGDQEPLLGRVPEQLLHHADDVVVRVVVVVPEHHVVAGLTLGFRLAFGARPGRGFDLRLGDGSITLGSQDNRPPRERGRQRNADAAASGPWTEVL